jgi:hypothetical protein
MLCGEPMREERGAARENCGMVERIYMCPNCLHRQVVVEEEGSDGLRDTEHPGE